MHRALLGLTATLCTFLGAQALGDTVQFPPSSTLIGEVKRLDRGHLSFKNDATGTISIEWEDVTRLESAHLLEIEMTNGERFLGYLSYAAEGHATLKTATSSEVVQLYDIVSMQPIETEFWERIDGDVSAGLDFSKDSEVLKTNFGVHAEYLTDDYKFNVGFDSNNTIDSDGEDSRRATLNMAGLRRLKGRWHEWAFGSSLGFERNDGLGIDLRSALGVGVQRSLLRSNQQRVLVGGGLQYTREDIADGGKSEESIEGVLTTSYELFRYDSPEVDLTTSLDVYPNLTDWGRVRADFNISLTWEFFEDTYWRLMFYDSYDSDPASVAADKNDYGVVTSLVWDY